MSLCFYVSLSLSLLSVSPLYLSQTYPKLTYAGLLTCPPPSLSLSPPSLFPDKKFNAAEAHFWLDKLFYIIEDDYIYSINFLKVARVYN
jgi:hypothetical protein